MTVVDEIVKALSAERLPFGPEAQFQEAVEPVMRLVCPDVIREHRFNPHSRIDFFVPSHGIGVECKVQGVFSQVERQLERYAQIDDVRVLVLVTASARLGQLPTTFLGKPLYVVATWRHGL